MLDVNLKEPQPDRIENTEARLRQEREELRPIVDLIPQTIIVLNPNGKPFMQTAWHWSIRGCLWTKCRPTIFGIAYSIIRTCRGFEKSGRRVFPARFYSKMSNGPWERWQIWVVPDPLQSTARRKRKGRTLVRN
jgi:hypothetical protein